MIGRYSTSITLTEDERAQVEGLKRKGYTIVGIFRRGLVASEKSPAEKTDNPDPEEIESKSFKEFKKNDSSDRYKCGCLKVEGKFLCKTHGRI